MFRLTSVLSLCLLIAFAVPAQIRAAAPASGAEAILRLKEGNERFVAGRSEHGNLDLARIRSTGENGQQPFATIIGCSDSRVPLELVLDQGIGDLFIIRVAGNVAGSDELGSIEYGVDHLHTPLLVVMGHTGCGACTAVANGTTVHGHIPELLAPITDSLKAVRSRNHKLAGNELVQAVVIENVWQSIEDILRDSPDTRQHLVSGRLKIIGAVYDIETGEVRWLGEHERQSAILAAAQTGSEQPALADAGAAHH